MKFLNAVIMLACLAYDEICGSITNVEAKLGQTVHLKFDKLIRNIDIELKYPTTDGVQQKTIIKDGKITKYGMERFGKRIIYGNGNLTIRDLEENDATVYVYKLGCFFQQCMKPTAFKTKVENCHCEIAILYIAKLTSTMKQS
ncbi:Carcinoembryonic antigen-related cell adhesion molecule [Dirofilaria immitis]